jgi:hypothetical protein
MARVALVSSLLPEFDDFLYALIDEDHDGTQLTVVSALARLEVDPWEQAAALASLPAETATQRLAALLAALPDKTSAQRDPRAIATRLIALLPSRTDPRVVWRHMLRDAHSPDGFRAFRYGVLIGTMLSVQWMVTSCQPPAQFSNASPPTSSTASPQLSLANSGQKR